MEYLVSQALTEWQIYNINLETENFLNEAEMANCIEYIIKKVILEMTETSKLILSIGYPMETEEQIIESIKNRAKIQVLEYSIKQNQPRDAMEIPNINMISNF